VVNRANERIVLFDESGTWSEYPRESGLSVFSPDLLTPAQYRPARPPTPYHRLLVAVLEDAIRCFQRNAGARRGPRRALFREVKEWLFDANGTGFMSFPVVCESLGIEAALLRRHLREWQARTTRGLQAPRLPRRTPISADKPITKS
jgi:hypothetical protein